MTFYTPIFTLFLLQHKLNLGFIVEAQTLYTVGLLISTIPTGALADRWGQKRTIQIGLLLYALSMLQILFLHSPALLLLYFAVRGIGGGFIDGADEALLYDSYKQEKGSAKGYSRAFGKMLSNDALGFVIATAIAGVAVGIMGKSSYDILIYATTASSIVAFTLASYLKPLKHKVEHRKTFVNQLKDGTKIIKRSRALYALVIVGLLTINGEYFLRQSYQPYFQNKAVPVIFLGLALSIGKLVNFFVIRNVHRLETRFSIDKFLLWINIGLGASYILMVFAGRPYLVVLMFIIIQSLMNSQQPVVSDYMNERIEATSRTSTLSTSSFIQSIGIIITRLLLGVSIGLFGLSHTFIVQGTYLIVGIAIGFWYLRRCGCVHRITKLSSASFSV